MEVQFFDRVLTCSDCKEKFIFTAGEQLFFQEKQFKNDPKRCKPCKGRRSGVAGETGDSVKVSGASRTETRTECSECGLETTVPFRPTQGRPVLCRMCFQRKNRAAAAARAAGIPAMGGGVPGDERTLQRCGDELADALEAASVNGTGQGLTAEAAVQAAASMEGARQYSSVASVADLEMISELSHGRFEPRSLSSIVANDQARRLGDEWIA